MRKELHFTNVIKPPQEYKNDNGKVYICVNDETGGLKLLLDTLINFWGSNRSKQNESRTPTATIRLAGIPLYQENRQTVSFFLANKNSH